MEKNMKILPAFRQTGKIITDANLLSTHVLDMDNLLQKPELPTGCESVALTIALNTLGYSLPKTEIAGKYLYYNDNNIVTGYAGSPFSTNGAGIAISIMIPA